MTLEPGATATLPLDPGFEYGVFVAHGAEVDGGAVERNALIYLGTGRGRLRSAADGGRRRWCCCSAASRSRRRS